MDMLTLSSLMKAFVIKNILTLCLSLKLIPPRQRYFVQHKWNFQSVIVSTTLRLTNSPGQRTKSIPESKEQETCSINDNY